MALSVDLKSIKDQIKDACEYWGIARKKDYKISWASKQVGITTDFWGKAGFSAKRRKVLLYIPPTDQDFLFHTIRGRLMMDFEDKDGSWHVATLIAICITPSINASRKKNLLRTWKTLAKTSSTNIVQYWGIIKSFPIDHLKNFVRELHATVSTDNFLSAFVKFSNTLWKYLQPKLKKHDVAIITDAITNQQYNPHKVAEKYNVSLATVYNWEKRYRPHLVRYFFPNMHSIGLQRLSFWVRGKTTAPYSLPLFEGQERFSHERFKQFKIWLPSRDARELLSWISDKRHIDILLESPHGTWFKGNPSKLSKGIETELRHFYGFAERGGSLEKTDLPLIQEILDRRTVMHHKLSGGLSRKQKRQKIRRYFTENILKESYIWARPLDMKTYLVHYPLDLEPTLDYKSLLGSFQDLKYDNPALSSILDYDWTYLTYTLGLKISGEEAIPTLVLRMTDTSDVTSGILRRHLDKMNIIGIHKRLPGTTFRLPEQYFENGEWKGVSEIIELLEYFENNGSAVKKLEYFAR